MAAETPHPLTRWHFRRDGQRLQTPDGQGVRSVAFTSGDGFYLAVDVDVVLAALEARRAEQHMRACDLTSENMNLRERLAASRPAAPTTEACSRFQVNTRNQMQRTNLSEMLRLYRTVKNMGVRELAKEIGIGAATVSRIERGGLMDLPTFLKLQAWMLK